MQKIVVQSETPVKSYYHAVYALVLGQELYRNTQEAQFTYKTFLHAFSWTPILVDTIIVGLKGINMNIRFKDYLQNGTEVELNSNDIKTVTGDEDNYILIEDKNNKMYKAMVMEWVDNVYHKGWK